MAEPLCCSLETTITLLISYTPRQNVFGAKKLKKKKKRNVFTSVLSATRRRTFSCPRIVERPPNA